MKLAYRSLIGCGVFGVLNILGFIVGIYVGALPGPNPLAEFVGATLLFAVLGCVAGLAGIIIRDDYQKDEQERRKRAEAAKREELRRLERDLGFNRDDR